MKYKALIYNAPKDFYFTEKEMPECGDKDVILKNVIASICGSDTDTWLNGGELHYMQPGVEFGHEVSCVVDQVGKDVKDVKIGDRVAPFPLLTTPNPRRAGFLGGFSEYIYCTNASYDYNLFHLSDKVSFEEGALIEPMSVGLRSSDIVPVTEKSIVLILGAGIIGYSSAVGFAWKGVPRDHITMIDRCQNRLDICKAEGFRTVNTGDENWKEELLEMTGKARCVYGEGSAADIIVDCAGSLNPNSTAPTLMEEGMKILKYGGNMVCVGVHRRQPKVNFQKLVFGMQNILCGSGNTKEYFERAIQVIESGKFNIQSVVTQTFSHDETVEAIKFTCNASQCMKVQIDYRL